MVAYRPTVRRIAEAHAKQIVARAAGNRLPGGAAVGGQQDKAARADRPPMRGIDERDAGDRGIGGERAQPVLLGFDLHRRAGGDLEARRGERRLVLAEPRLVRFERGLSCWIGLLERRRGHGRGRGQGGRCLAWWRERRSRSRRRHVGLRRHGAFGDRDGVGREEDHPATGQRHGDQHDANARLQAKPAGAAPHSRHQLTGIGRRGRRARRRLDRPAIDRQRGICHGSIRRGDIMSRDFVRAIVQGAGSSVRRLIAARCAADCRSRWGRSGWGRSGWGQPRWGKPRWRGDFGPRANRPARDIRRLVSTYDNRRDSVVTHRRLSFWHSAGPSANSLRHRRDRSLISAGIGREDCNNLVANARGREWPAARRRATASPRTDSCKPARIPAAGRARSRAGCSRPPAGQQCEHPGTRPMP